MNESLSQGEGAPARHREACGDCRGSGVFTTWAGRSLGPCRRCRGAGFLEFARDAEQRAKARIQAEQRTNRKVEENWGAFAASHPQPAAWILANQDRFDFALSMRQAVQKYGYLTSGQASAVARCMERDEQRIREREQAHAPAAAPGAAVSGPEPARVCVPVLFGVMQRHAQFYAGKLVISRKNGDSMCWLKWGGRLVGKLERGEVHWFRAASAAVCGEAGALLAEFEADPLAAAVKYGKLSGRCCSCGRDLTDPVSIDAGIGPICRERFGG